MRLRFQRIPEEDQEVDLLAYDLGADLLVAAKGAAAQFLYSRVERQFEQRSRGSGGALFMLLEQVAVVLRPLQQIFLLVVVCYEGDPLA